MCVKVKKMAALRGSKLSYLFLNFVNNFAASKANFHKTRQTLFHCSSLFFGPEGIKMPSLSPTMSEGKIVKWLKKEGDVINPGDVLCDIETDKAVVSMEMEEEGVLAKILVPENSQSVKVGALIAIMVSQGEDWKNVEIPAGEEVSSPKAVTSSTSPKEVETSSDQESAFSCPLATPVKMPSLSPTMTSGTIIRWLKKEGDVLAPGDELCEIQTDKAVMTMEAEDEGILAKIIVPNDTKDVKVNTLIAVIVPVGEDWKKVAVTSKPVKEKKEVSGGAAGITGEVRGKSFGPAVRALLSLYKIEPGLIKATGRGNRLLKEDVVKYIAENSLEKKPPQVVSPPSKKTQTCSITHLSKGSTKKVKGTPTRINKYKDIEVNNSRLIIAKRLVESKQQVPHSYSTAKCDVGGLIKIKEAFSTDNIKVSVNDLLIKILGLTLQMYPKANALFINNEVQLLRNVDICVTLVTETGSYTPMIKAVNQKSVVRISEEMRELTENAKAGKLKPEEIQGGTFSISNLGMFNISHFKAVINPPQSGILAVGGVLESLNSNLEVERHILVSMSYDRRIFEEHEAAVFLEIFKHFTENPKVLTLGVNQYVRICK